METFIKENHFNNNSLIDEVEALKLIQKTLDENNILEIKTPKIFSYDKNCIVMQRVNQTNPTSSQQTQLGIALAKIHSIKQKHYGFEHDNFIGLNIQKNSISNNWGEFFYQYRLMFQISIIKDKKIKEEFYKVFENIKEGLIEFLNNSCEYSSLVHGDLWSGNVIFEKDSIYLIDPAIYYADREVDIAMTEMFGGFSMEFYKAYEQSLPLSKEYSKKKYIYNLYHYLNHFNLFGKSYLNSCVTLLETIKTYKL